MPVEPKLAATVIVLRERVPDSESDDDCEFEVLMAKRHKNARFMSEHYVFPGGSVDEQDLANESKARLIGLENNIVNSLFQSGSIYCVCNVCSYASSSNYCIYLNIE